MQLRSRIDARRYQFTALPSLPDDFAAFSDEQLTGLESELRAYYTESRPTAPTADLLPVVEGIERVRAEIGRRVELAAQPSADDLDARFALTAPAPEVETPAVETPAAGEATELITASAVLPAPMSAEQIGGVIEQATRAGIVTAMREINPPVPTDLGHGRSLSAFRPAFQTPQAPAAAPGERSIVSLTAAGGLPNFRDGEVLPGWRELVEAHKGRWQHLGNPIESVRMEEIPVAQVTAVYPEDRKLARDDGAGNTEKIMALFEPEALAASGGLCAPVAPYYNLMVVAEDLRPVAASLATFQADRGGVRYIPPPHLSDLTAAQPDPNPYFLGNAVGTETVQQDAAGGTKTCLDVPCAAPTEVDIEIIWRCLQFSNVTARTFPEQVDAFVRLAMAEWARAAEELLLTNIAASCTPVTAAKTFGTSRQLFGQLGRIAAYLRNNNRTDPALQIRTLLPAWLKDAIRVDLTDTFAGSMDFFEVSDAMIDGILATYGVVPAWYIDTATGAGQLFTAAASGQPAPSFPSTVVSYNFFEGSFLHLDAGILDLGIIRDSILTAQNKFRNFAESFENVAFIGPEAIACTHTACPDGGVAAAYVIASQACTSDQ